MNAPKNAVSKMTRCPKCKTVFNNRKVGDECGVIKSTISLGIITCEGALVLTNGQTFRGQKGYSKLFKRNMKKQGLDPESSEDVKEYKTMRRARKKNLRKEQSEKRKKSTAHKRAYGKKGRFKKG